MTVGSRGRSIISVCTVFALFVPPHRAAAQGATSARPDSVRGRVTTDSGAVITGADVIITIAPSTKTVRQTTDSTGHYAMAIADGTGEYILYIGAAGRKPFRERLTRVGRDSTFVVDAKLASAITTVAAVKVVAQKPHPSPSLAGTPGAGTSGNDKSVDGVNGALPPDLANNTDAMASLIPGLAVGAGGVSAFGMSSDANSHTLNGLNYGGGDLPRDVRTTTRFATSTWDPTIGEFAGVAVQQQLAAGDNISRRTAHLTFDSPALQFSDPIASHLGAEYSNTQLSEGGTGAYALDKLYYNYGVQASRRTASIASLADLDAAALSLSGVSRDSAARLIQTLGALHIPVNVAGVSPRLVTNSISFTERIDHQLPTVPRGSVPLPAWALTTVVSYANADPSSLSPVSPTTTGGTTSSANGFLQGQYTRYFGKDGAYLNETSSALQYSDNRGTPYLSLPGGNVLIASALPDGTTGLGALNFGGNSVLSRNLQQYSWELKNQTDFLGGGSINLPLKVYLQSRVDGFTQSPGANRLGSFSFPSLDALAKNDPSTFARTLNAPGSSGNEWVGAAAFGGTWTHDKLTLTGGLRAEGNAYLTAPAENPAIETLFGARTDHEPNTFAVLPRLGFTYRIPGQQGMSAYKSPISTSYRGPSVIRGGIGEFRGATRPMLLSNAMTSTGLPGGMERLLCTGSATPTPDWQVYAADTAAIPSTCVNSSTLADTAPSVTLLDKHWSPTESWRATLGYSKTLLATYLSIDANYALNLHQPGTYDLNFAGAPQFSIADEGGRPVYVSPSNIDPARGRVIRAVAHIGRIRPRGRSARRPSRRCPATHGVCGPESSVQVRLCRARVYVCGCARAIARLRPEHGGRSTPRRLVAECVHAAPYVSAPDRETVRQARRPYDIVARPVGTPIHAARGRRHQRRRSLQRSRLRFQSGHGDRRRRRVRDQLADGLRSSVGTRVSRQTGRPGRGAEQLHGSVECDDECGLLPLQSPPGNIEARVCRRHIPECARRSRRTHSWQQSSAGLGDVAVSRPDAPASARL